MNSDNTQDDAEPSLASAGSQPAAWMTDDGNYFTSKIRLAREWREAGVDLVPLYVCQPQPTLTAEEWASVKNFLTVGRLYSHEAVAGVLRRLLGDTK